MVLQIKGPDFFTYYYTNVGKETEIELNTHLKRVQIYHIWGVVSSWSSNDCNYELTTIDIRFYVVYLFG